MDAATDAPRMKYSIDRRSTPPSYNEDKKMFKHRHVYIYNDKGASESSVEGWTRTLHDKLHYPTNRVHTTRSDTLIADITSQHASEIVLIMPGGADLPYVDLLHGTRVAQIRATIAAGASYIGTCAGAYFASCACIFEANDDAMRVIGQRELSLVSRAAIGAVRDGFKYGSEEGATIERLSCEWRGMAFTDHVYCNGGAAWVGLTQRSDAETLARFYDPVLKRHGIDEKHPAAVIKQLFGKGVAILSGVHPEMSFPNVIDGISLKNAGSNDSLLRCIAEASRLVPLSFPNSKKMKTAPKKQMSSDEHRTSSRIYEGEYPSEW